MEAELVAVARALGAEGLLRVFNEAGVLGVADVHAAVRIAELTGEQDEQVRLAAALAVRAPRLGHVFVDLESVRSTASVESEEPVDLSELPWPEPIGWIARVAASPLAGVGEDEGHDARPFRLLGSRLYLDRYWREERAVASDLLQFAGREAPAVDLDVLADGLARLFPDEVDARQRLAARAAVLLRLAVVAGGPGTGKTTTVARILALLAEQATAAGERPPLVALAAPTGKAAARLQEAIREEAMQLAVTDHVRALLRGSSAATLHRLLGWRPGSHSRFRHERQNRLPHDVVIVDEMSMVSLSMIARLSEAVRPEARLILVGDPGQLRSIEAGVVLGDIVGPVAEGASASGSAIGDGIVVLDHVHRYGASIAALADAVRRGDADATIAALRAGADAVSWLELDPVATISSAALRPVREAFIASGRAVVEAARAGDAVQALQALGEFRLLCAHRRGPHGVSTWTSQMQAWLSEAVDGLDLDQRDYVGRPLLVTANDYELDLANGDAGVVIATGDGGLLAVFQRGGDVVGFSPLRLDSVETVYAMTIHKSQGSQFGTATLVLPPSDSRILTRELLYTGVTRARERLIVVGSEDSIRAAVGRPVARASGLRERLWGESLV